MSEFDRSRGADGNGGRESGASAGTPGKRTLTSKLRAASPRVRPAPTEAQLAALEHQMDPTEVGGGGGLSVPIQEVPAPAVAGGAQPAAGGSKQAAGGGAPGNAQPSAGGGAQPAAGGAGKRIPTTVRFTGPVAGPAAGDVTCSAPDYAGLYAWAASRAGGGRGKEAGAETGAHDTFVVGQLKDSDPDGAEPAPTAPAVSATVTVALTVDLPTWTTYASQPPEDQRKFDAWKASVSAHEQKHVALDRREWSARLAAAAIIGPTVADVRKQVDAVAAEVQAAQDALDADTSQQPAPLAAPGGVTKVP